MSDVLILAETEVIFFIAPAMVLLFGLVLITQGCFSHCRAVLTQCQGLFCFTYSVSEKIGVTRNQERTQPEQLSPTDQRGRLLTYGIMLST